MFAQTNFCSKKKQLKFRLSWNHWLHPRKKFCQWSLVCPESKFRTHPNLYQLNWWFIYSIKVILHLILHCAYMDLKHIILFKENKKLFKAIKTQTKNKNFSQQNIEILSSCLDSRGTWRKLYRLLKSFFLFHLVFFFLNWDSLHARLNSLCKAWSCKKKKHKKIKDHLLFAFPKTNFGHYQRDSLTPTLLPMLIAVLLQCH